MAAEDHVGKQKKKVFCPEDGGSWLKFQFTKQAQNQLEVG